MLLSRNGQQEVRVIHLAYCLFLSSPVQAEIFHLDEGDSIQAAINAVVPGDTIVLAAGTYEEDFSTERDGESGAPITLKSDEDAEVIISADGEVFQIDHSHWRIEGLVFDGQFGSANIIDINDDADFLVMDGVEVRRSGNDCIDMDGPAFVEIKNSRIHHCLRYDEDSEDLEEAHGIRAGAVQDLNITNTEIHTFSGSGIQLDPSRSEPGWNNVTIEACNIWLEPLTESVQGFPEGLAPGKNAIQTKTPTGGTRAVINIKESTFWGFQEGRDFTELSALLFWENIDATVTQSHIYDSDIAVRVRRPVLARPEGAQVSFENSVIEKVATGFRYEREIESLTVSFVTMGRDVVLPFDAADDDATDPTVRNSLFMVETLPTLAESGSNGLATTDDFIDASAGDYHLRPSAAAIDAGEVIPSITVDFDGSARTQGEAPDQGAFEFTPDGDDTGVIEDTGEPDPEDTGSPSTDTDIPDDTGISNDADAAAGGGVGAAESVGEKGGCGCTQSTSAQGRTWPILLLCFGLLVGRRRI